MASNTYEETLAEAKKVGAAHASDAGLIALFCDSPNLHILCGAVSAKLVFEGTQVKGLSYREFAHLASENPQALESLMWV